MGSNIDPTDQVIVTISGDTTGFVTGNPPNDATGDLDAIVSLPGAGWTLDSEEWEISTDPTLGTASIDPLTGTWIYTVDPAVFDSLDFGEIVSDTFVVTLTVFASNPGGRQFFNTATQAVTINIEGVCFTAGTLIDTDSEPVEIEKLAVGDLVATADNGPQPIRWIEGSHVSVE